MDNLNILEESKKGNTCSLCHQKLTFFGSHTLKDGTICRSCFQKASPFIEDDLNEFTLLKFGKHLMERLHNKNELTNMNMVKVVDGNNKLYIDIPSRKFIISSSDDYKEENADLVLFDEIQSVSIKEENYYDGPSINLYVDILLVHEYIKHIQFRINEFPGIEKGSQEYLACYEQGLSYLKAFLLMDPNTLHQIKYIRSE